MDVIESQRVPPFTVFGIVRFFQMNNFRLKLGFLKPSLLYPIFLLRPVFFLCDSFYTCDKQVLWEVRVVFFPRDNSLISRGNSHVSRVRGLVVRCLPFNPEVSCSNPWECANFFTSIPKQKILTFFGTMRLFGFVRLFFEIF